MSTSEPPQKTTPTTADRISDRYGVPPNEVDAVIADERVATGDPHPMTLGVLVKDQYQSKGSIMAQPHARWTPASVIGITLGILGILAIATLLVFLMNWNRQPREVFIPAPETIEPTLDTALPPVPDTVVIVQTPAAPPPVQQQRAPRRRVVRPVLTTSNSMEAEERLAELRAEGNANARIRRVSRNGTTLFEVRK